MVSAGPHSCSASPQPGRFPPGSHSIRAHNTLVWKTLTFEAKLGEHVEFDVANRPGRGFLSAMALLGVGPLFLTFVQRRGGPDASQGTRVASA